MDIRTRAQQSLEQPVNRPGWLENGWEPPGAKEEFVDLKDWSEDHDPFRAPWNGRRAGRNEESEHLAPSSPYRHGSAAIGQADPE